MERQTPSEAISICSPHENIRCETVRCRREKPSYSTQHFSDKAKLEEAAASIQHIRVMAPRHSSHTKRTKQALVPELH